MQVYVSEKYKFVFIRQPKSSSTAVLHGLEALVCDGTLRKGGCSSDQLRRVTNPRKDISRDQWKDFFVFTVVRNPWIRMLSAYSMFNEGFLHRYVAIHMIFVCNSLKIATMSMQLVIVASAGTVFVTMLLYHSNECGVFLHLKFRVLWGVSFCPFYHL